jgi:hypothetical protein
MYRVGTGTSSVTNTYVQGGDRYSTFGAGQGRAGQVGFGDNIHTYIHTYIRQPCSPGLACLCCWQKWVCLPYAGKKISSVKEGQ